MALQVGAEHKQLQPVGCCRGRSSHRYKSNYKIKATVWVCARTCVGGVCAPPRGRVQMDGNKESDSSNELLAE